MESDVSAATRWQVAIFFARLACDPNLAYDRLLGNAAESLHANGMSWRGARSQSLHAAKPLSDLRFAAGKKQARYILTSVHCRQCAFTLGQEAEKGG